MTSLSHQKLEVILSLQLLLRESSPIVPLNLMTLVWHPWHVWHPNSCYETIVSDKQKKEVPHIHLPWRVLVIIHTGHNSYHELEVKETYPIHQITKNTFNFVILVVIEWQICKHLYATEPTSLQYTSFQIELLIFMMDQL